MSGEHPGRCVPVGLDDEGGKELEVSRENVVRNEKYSSSHNGVCGRIRLG